VYLIDRNSRLGADQNISYSKAILATKYSSIVRHHSVS
jgi:hypothetical protein